MIDWLVSVFQPLVEIIQGRPRWVDGALILSAGLAFAFRHWLGAQRICGTDGRVRRTTAEALKHTRLERVCMSTGVAALAAWFALHACDDLRTSDGDPMRHLWTAKLLISLAFMCWGGFATVAALRGKPVWPRPKKAESDEFVVWKQKAFFEYAKKVPYPGTPAGEQPAGR